MFDEPEPETGFPMNGFFLGYVQIGSHMAVTHGSGRRAGHDIVVVMESEKSRFAFDVEYPRSMGLQKFGLSKGGCGIGVGCATGHERYGRFVISCKMHHTTTAGPFQVG